MSASGPSGPLVCNCMVGKDWAGPFFPPSLIFRSSIDRFVFQFMLLFHSILTFMKDLYQSENQVFNPTRLLVLLHCWVGKTGPAHSFPPPSIMLGSFNLLFSLSVYVTLSLYLRDSVWRRPSNIVRNSSRCPRVCCPVWTDCPRQISETHAVRLNTVMQYGKCSKITNTKK